MSGTNPTPTAYDLEQDEWLKKQGKEIDKLNEKVFPDAPTCPPGQHWDIAQNKCVPDKDEDCGPNPDPSNEHVKEGGWGGDTASAKTWESVPMKDDPTQFKVVDKSGVNIAHKFASEAEADKYIAYHTCMQEKGNVICPPGQHEDPATGQCVPDKPDPEPTGAYPYPAIGQPLSHTIRRAVRHYASGKPDDETIEANVKSIKFKNYQCVVDITIHEMEHDDTASLKFGGTHMGTGWFDNSVGIFTGKTGLGTEPKHPSTNLYIVKGPAIGDIRNKRVKIAGVYYTDTNKCELWTNIGPGWIKQVEATNVGGFNPKSSEDEFQLRIDGFKKGSQTGKPPEPEIHGAVVTEIAAPN